MHNSYDYHYNKISQPFLSLTDCYKLGRIFEYPKGTSMINEVLICRDVNYFDEPIQSLVKQYGHIVAGIQYTIQKTQNSICESLLRPESENALIEENREIFKGILGKEFPESFANSIVNLRRYVNKNKRLPIKYRWIEEGKLVPIGTPIMEFRNTEDEFFWLPNFMETLVLSNVWLALTNATKNFYLSAMLTHYARKTGSDIVQYQAHDFSMRGQAGLDASEQVAIGHMMNFTGTDTLISIPTITQYYDYSDETPIGSSVSAFEHSSVTTNIQYIAKKYNISLKEAEARALEHFITSVYPTGIVAYVADSYDFWGTVESLNDKYVKNAILNRDGKVVIRPDSGNPYDIICGLVGIDTQSLGTTITYETLGLIRSLDIIFGSTINEAGYKVLNSKIGAIYGDGMTYERINKILSRLTELGYASENIVFGVGANWQSNNTRDNLGVALKTTLSTINNENVWVVKDPKTGSKSKKKSPCGDVKVAYDSFNKKWMWWDMLSINDDADLFDDELRYNNTLNFSNILINIQNERQNILNNKDISWDILK